MRHIIIGAGVAGLYAAKQIKLLNPDDDVKILSKESLRPYSKMVLPYILSGDSTFENSCMSVPFGVELIKNKEAIKIDTKNKFVETKDSEKFYFDKLLIASGANPYAPDIKSLASFTVRNAEDVDRIKTKIDKVKGKPVILSGAGLVNMEVADALNKIGVPFIFVAKSDRVLSQIIDSEASKILENVLSGHKIFKGESIKNIEEKNGGVFVTLESGKEIEGSCVVFGKGVRPAIEMLKDTEIKVNRGIVVNEHLETSVKDIYAAGDVAESKDVVFGDTRVHALWPVAVEQGKIAGLNMANKKEFYKGSVSRNILSVFGKTIFTGGISTEDKFEVIKRVQDGEYKKIVLKDNILKGFVFVSEVTNPGVYTYIMTNEIEVKNLKDKLLDGAISYSDLHRKAYTIKVI
jgi:NAD(P)H-nitrite reductase large subunit